MNDMNKTVMQSNAGYPAHTREQLRVAVLGHVDHGKSTLVGRLIHDTGSLPDGKADAIRAMCERRGLEFEWAFLLDAFQAERDQGITIDTSQIWFRSGQRDYVIVDAPGHREFIKNMITGAASADAALLLIDAAQGVQRQTKLHGFLLNMLGVKQLIVVINKMDQVGFDPAVFQSIGDHYQAYLQGLGLAASAFIPVSARQGDNIVTRSAAAAWYKGPKVIEALAHFTPAQPPAGLPLRFPVQDVYKFDDRRIIAGRIESGEIKIGDELLFSPSNKTARVASIESWPTAWKGQKAEAGQSIGITLDEQIFVERGEIASNLSSPPLETNVFHGRIFWLGADPLQAGHIFRLRLGTREVSASIQKIERVYDTDQLQDAPGDQVERHGVADILIRTSAVIALDGGRDLPRTGRFVLDDGHNIVAGGLIDMRGYPDQRAGLTRRATNIVPVAHRVSRDMRIARQGHRGGVIWLTGLSGAGKSTLAMAAEQELFSRGYHVYVLDGDNVRDGLNANLGFSPDDRAENIRRVGEVAALFADAGIIAITAFISPYRSDRRRARKAAGDHFREIYVKAALAACEARDPKGLYQRARKGEIADFTGISAPYEEPESPDLVIDTEHHDIQHSVDRIVSYVMEEFGLDSKPKN